MAKTHSANVEIEMEESASKRVESPHNVSASIINRVASDIRGRLESLGPPLSHECCIYRVPKKLRMLNEGAYTPQVVSIGPFHHGKKTLKKMEKHKLRYLKKFLERVTNSLEYFVCTIKDLELRIRSCYVESFDHLNSETFVEMILVDAGFIFEFFLRKVHTELQDQNDSILYKQWLRTDIQEDLILLENQLPFFVLETLYDEAFFSSPNGFLSFRNLTRLFFSHYNKQNKVIGQGVKHFTDLLRSFQLSTSETNDDIQNDKSNQRKVKYFIDWLRHFLPHCCRREIGDQAKHESNDRIDNLYSATELHDAGVKFEVSPSKCLLHIKFSDGVLAIPCLQLYDDAESYFRNLMALEQCHYPSETAICNYVLVMDHLINTAKDVDLLVRKKIIVNWLGDRVPVATLFNKLCTNIAQEDDSHYISLCKGLNAHYNVRYHRWKAILRHEYFSTPWRITSIIAAIILLVLTLIQTICAIISQ